MLGSMNTSHFSLWRWNR